MDRHQGRIILASVLLVLVVVLGLAVAPASAMSTSDSGTGPTHERSHTHDTADQDRTVSVVYDVELPGEGDDRMALTIRADGVEGEELGFRLRGEDIEILQADGFVRDGTWLYTTGNTSNATVTVTYDPSEQLVTSFQDDFVATPEWALFRLELSAPESVAVSEYLEPEGARGDTYVFVGPHERYERSVGDDRIVLIAPDAANFADPPEAIADSLAETSRYLRVGARAERTLVIGAPEELRQGGLASSRGDDMWVRADLSLGRNTWAHEYVHLRQDRFHFSDARWLHEAEARYFQHLIAFKQGHLEHDGSTGFDGFQSQLHGYDGHDDVRLQDPGTWQRNSNYEKGAKALAVIDAEIRDRTDGERDYRHVMFQLNQRSHVTAIGFAEAVEAVAGEPVDELLESYVNGTEMPDVPDDPEQYREFPMTPEVAYNVSERVETDAPPEADVPGTPVFSNETVNVTVTIRNDGIDGPLYPNIDISPPEQWEYRGFRIDGGTWEPRDTTSAGGMDISPDEAIEISIELGIPDVAGQRDAIEIDLVDADGEGVERRIEMTSVDPVIANVTVDEPVHEPGTAITLDASNSEVPGEVVSYEWDLTGNGTIDRVTDSPTITARFEPGAREVTVRVTNDIGVWDNGTVRVGTTDTPIISVEERVVTEAHEWFEIYVNVTNEHGSTWVVWELPDGNTTAGQTGVFRASPGIFELNVTAIDEFGGENRTTVEIISVDRPNIARLSPVVIPANQSVLLRAEVEKEVGAYNVTWRMPDGVTRTGEEAIANLPPGLHRVSVIAIDEFGFESNITRTIVVSDVPAVSLEGPDTATAGESVRIEATIDNAFGTTIVSWRVGDEVRLTESDYAWTRAYPAGVHEISVTVIDEFGMASTTTHEIYVENAAEEVNERDDDEVEADDGDSPTGSGGDDEPADALPGFGLGMPVAALIVGLAVRRRVA